VVLSLPIREAIELEGAFKQAGFRTQFSRGESDDPIPGMLRLSDEHANAVDLLIGLRGMEAEAFSRAVEVAFQGVKVKFIGLEDFIAMKVFAAGAMDLMDASRAIAVSRKSLDVFLARRLAGNYGSDAAAALETLLEA
jgi:predicted nucleotidyltransferase